MYLSGVFLYSSVEFTSFHSLFTLVFIFLVLVNSTKEGHICRPPERGAFLLFSDFLLSSSCLLLTTSRKSRSWAATNERRQRKNSWKWVVLGQPKKTVVAGWVSCLWAARWDLCERIAEGRYED